MEELKWTETKIHLKICGYVDIRIYVISNKEYVVVSNNLSSPLLCRVHSECLTGDILGSEQCDCGDQLQKFLNRFKTNNCMLIYVKGDEGRGIGLFNKIKAYDIQKKLSMNTIESNIYLGFDADHRSYEDVKKILSHMKIEKINLVSNNPEKIKTLQDFIDQVIPDPADINVINDKYIKTKRQLMGHKGIID